MVLARILEAEVMESEAEATDYDSMDHSDVNRQFVDDLLSAGFNGGDALDLGSGTALIPIELCKRVEECRVMAIDLSIAMLEVARYNVEIAGFRDRIVLDHLDGKDLPFEDDSFRMVLSNSIVHHIPDPRAVFREAMRIVEPDGLVFFRDLMRPCDQTQLENLVSNYAGNDSDSQQKMFRDSLHAALTVEEVRELTGEVGAAPETVQATSDRHWTWVLRTDNS
jgi:ubiquinone/menaquinone biosynthesis C-methylase UbiE